MGLRFYFGASGGGKSTKLHEEIVRRGMEEPNTNFLIIVPDQFTMQTQMDLVKAHPKKGIMNIDVLSFGRLSHRILEEVGADRRAVLDDTGKSLVLRKVAENIQEEMPVIGSNLRKIGYIHEVKSVISEFMQYGIGEKELGELAAYAEKRGALYHKLKDLELLYKNFLEYIQDKYITTEETLDLLCGLLPKSRMIKGSVIAFDGFTGFTPIQNRLIQRLMMLAGEVIVTVVLDAGLDPYKLDGEQKLFYLSKKTTADLRKLAAEAGVPFGKDVFLKEERLPRFQNNEEMQHLEKYLFRYPAKVYGKDNEALHLFETSSPGEEMRQVCIEIKRLIREKHYCYRDFAIVTGNMETYAGHAQTEAAKFEIPVFIDQTKGILLNPFIEYIRSALRIVMENFSYQSVFHYLRSGLADFTREETDLLENYVIARGIKGKKRWTDIFTGKDDEGGAEELARLNGIRERFVEQLTPLTLKAGTAGEKIRALYGFITENKVQEKLAAYEKMFERRNDAARAKEYGQIYRLVIDLLDQIESLLSDEKMNMKEFADILDAGFGEIEVGMIPQNVDRVVVGDIERTRLKEIKVLFFIGVNDGNIPKNAGMGGIISDIDREFLQESPYALAPTPRQQMYIQRLYLYMNMTKPSEHLYLSYCKVGGEGKSLRPSYLIDTISKLFPRLKAQKPELKNPEEKLETKRAGLDYLTAMLREYAAGRLGEEGRRRFFTVYRAYLGDEAYKNRTGELIEAAFTYYREKGLGREIAGALYGNLLVSSVSRLETYAACAYAHFLKYGLSLEEREEYSFEATDMGNVFHGVLELFAGKLQERGYTWFDFGEKEAEEMLTQAMEGYAAAYGNTILYSTARNEYAIDRMYRILKRTVLTLQHQLKKGSFIPENFELSFQMADDLEAVNIALSGEERMKLRGRIDRIDTYEDEEHVYVKVIDYKSGNRKFNLAALYYGLQLQLVVYMNAAVELERKKNPNKEVVPAALLYYHVSDPMVKAEVEVTPEEINEKLLKELRMTGVVTENDKVISLLDGEFSDKSDVVPVERKKDGSYSAKSSVITGDDMGEISSYVNHKIKQIGMDIMRGNIEINPYEQSGGTSCDYCEYKSVCGFDEGISGYGYRKLENLEEQEALERIRTANSKS